MNLYQKRDPRLNAYLGYTATIIFLNIIMFSMFNACWSWEVFRLKLESFSTNSTIIYDQGVLINDLYKDVLKQTGKVLKWQPFYFLVIKHLQYMNK